MKLKVTVNGTEYVIDVEVEEEDQHSAILSPVVIGGVNTGNNPIPTRASMPAASSNAVVAPLAGSVARILVKEGDAIEAGQVLVVLEAMKMETEITAPSAGTVGRILVEQSQPVQGGQALIEFA
ncbi:MAG TPA: biotin/lipoyl-binding protein [Candidatus Luteococcus avicola]|uniref:Biotin/lipoyl-containing protein n=1 Tax=Luteococcus sanguinis TaxID=174038 RepID=A0ABW1WZ93_9ACTN|nr:biotin/lipoyl-binding protein [Candidatus Luteococcus avicola]